MKAIGVNGSTQLVSKTAYMLGLAMGRLRREYGVDCFNPVNLYELSGLEPYLGYNQVPQRDLKVVLNAVSQSQIVVLATSVAWQQPTSLMKMFIDNLTYLELQGKLEGKVAGVILHCDTDGAFHVGSEMAGTLMHMGMMLPPFGITWKNKYVRRNHNTEWQFRDVPLLADNCYQLASLVHETPGFSGRRWNNE